MMVFHTYIKQNPQAFIMSGRYVTCVKTILVNYKRKNINFFLKANATGRNAKTVHEFLQKYYTPEEVATEKGTIKLAIRALLEVVQSGRKNLEIAVMRRGQPLQVYKL